MTPFQIIAVLITLAAAFHYINHRYFHMPASIALMMSLAAQASDGAAACVIDGGVVYVDSEAALRRRMLAIPERKGNREGAKADR